MATEGLVTTEQLNEFEQIIAHIDNGNNFLLSGGAGSGKTYSLVEIIKTIISKDSSSKIACITYTNAAVKEIKERVNNKNLSVSTIHDFLWNNIKNFKQELRSSLIFLINDENTPNIKIKNVSHIKNDFFENRDRRIEIQYKEYLRLKEGIISHDELLVLAEYMFRIYPKLCDIVKDRYKYIFIDEYQDTQSNIIKIFLEHFAKTDKKNIIGFFGDSMQAIYENGIGDLDIYKGVEGTQVREVKKHQNRRNPKSIINLANLLRTDALEQTPSNDLYAPNMIDGQIKDGKILFIYSTNDNIESVRQYLSANYNWNFDDGKNTKELNLTHNLIAEKAGFEILMNIYDKDQILTYRDRVRKYIKENNVDIDLSSMTFGQVVSILKDSRTGSELKKVLPTNTMQTFIDDQSELYEYACNYDYNEFLNIYIDKDQLIDDKKQDEKSENKKGSKRDDLIKHLYKLQTNITLYTAKKYNEFLRVTDYGSISSIEDKITLKNNIESLLNVGDKTIREVIIEANDNKICIIGDKLEKFISNNKYVYDRVKCVKFKEFQKLYEYLEGKTPFSTQHKTKGAEYNNVFVILDNGKWNNYNFENLFLQGGKVSVLKRTQKIFYVCCTRAKENLAVFYHSPSVSVISKANEWFGSENVISI